MNQSTHQLRLASRSNRLPSPPATRWALPFPKAGIARAIRIAAPTLFALAFASAAQAQGTMDFTGATTLMTTFKTTVLATIREGAEASGYIVEGFAPTSKAAGQLREAGIDATTLQSFLARGQNRPSDDPANRHLYMLDESSLASTKQMRLFLGKLNPEDRVLIIGDTRQHQGVEAGRPFQQMQEAGMQTSQLDKIMRQKDPELLKAVQHLANNETVKGISMLAEQGRVTEIPDGQDRIAAIARDYAARPDKTIIVSPDNRSRQQINEAVRLKLRKNGILSEDGQTFPTLTHRSDMTGADRTWAARYNPGDILQYSAGSKFYGIKRDSFSVVHSIDTRRNTLTVSLDDGSTITYDPRRLRGVHVYQEARREFSTGDRIQFTSNLREFGISNRQLGTIEEMSPNEIRLRLDGNQGRSVTFRPEALRHLDHGYAVTSHSSQGLTADRVLINVEVSAHRNLINQRFAYVAVSRGAYDVRLYTQDISRLAKDLGRETSKLSALSVQSGNEPERKVAGDHSDRLDAVKLRIVIANSKDVANLEEFSLSL